MIEPRPAAKQPPDAVPAEKPSGFGISDSSPIPSLVSPACGATPPTDPAAPLNAGEEEPVPQLGSNWFDPIAGLFLGLSNVTGPESASTTRYSGANVLAADMVRCIAWGGDRRRGTARIELGGSRFSGATLIVNADGDELSVELHVPSGVDADELSSRLTQRFADKGLMLRELRVHQGRS